MTIGIQKNLSKKRKYQSITDTRTAWGVVRKKPSEIYSKQTEKTLLLQILVVNVFGSFPEHYFEQQLLITVNVKAVHC